MRPAWEARPVEDAPCPAGLPERDEIAAYHLMDEMRLVGGLVERAIFTATERNRIADRAARLVRAARANRHKHGGVDAFMHEYGLTSEEGIILMCLAEALLRIPDKDTADALIAEKIGGGRWEKHLGAFRQPVRQCLHLRPDDHGPRGAAGRGQGRGAGGRPQASRRAARASRSSARRCARPCASWATTSCSAAPSRRRWRAPRRSRPRATASPTTCWASGPRRPPMPTRYFGRYMSADRGHRQAHAPARGALTTQALMARPSISVKLSAIHPRFDPGKEERLTRELLPRLVELAAAARRVGLGAHHRCRGAGPARPDARAVRGRLHAIRRSRAGRAWASPCRPTASGRSRCCAGCGGWPAIGGKQIPVRLVKGAYWDSEIKWAQERGLADYPVLTRKLHTDVSYLACLRLLLSDPARVLSRSSPPTTRSPLPPSASPRLARDAYEFQRLHGMGEAVYEEVVGERQAGRALPHLRAGRAARGPRGLSGAAPARERRQHVVRQPAGRRGSADRGDRPRSRGHRRGGEGTAGAPARCCRGRRRSSRPSGRNSRGMALDQPSVREALRREIEAELKRPFAAAPIVDGKARPGGVRPSRCCARTTGASASARCTAPMPPRSRRPSPARARRRMPGTGWAGRRGPPSWTGPPTSTSATACG